MLILKAERWSESTGGDSAAGGLWFEVPDQSTCWMLEAQEEQ